MLSAAIFRWGAMGPWLWYVAHGCQFVSPPRALASISRAIFFQFSQPITTPPAHLFIWFWAPQASRLRLCYPTFPYPAHQGGAIAMSATSPTALASEPRALSGKPRWGGPPGSPASQFIEDAEDFFVGKGIGAILFKEKFDLPALEGDKLKIANATVLSALRKAIPSAIYQTIEAEATSIAAATDGGGAKAAALIGAGAKKLWAAIIKKTHGRISATPGFDLQRDTRTWAYPSGPPFTHVERISLAISQQQSLCARAAALKDSQFPHTQAQACHAIAQLLPPMLALNKRQYRSYLTLAELGNELAIDAAEFDTGPQMVALAAKLPGAPLTALVTKPKKTHVQNYRPRSQDGPICRPTLGRCSLLQ